MFSVWFYAALPVARKSGQGFNVWFFADKSCVARRHSRMRAVAVGLLSLRHVHQVHQVHQVHPAKCFVTSLAPQLLIVHRVSGSVVAGAYRQPLHPGARWHREAG